MSSFARSIAGRPSLRSYCNGSSRDLVTYHQRKRAKQNQVMCRKFAGDIDADDPVIVEGDGKGNSKLEPFAESRPRPVTLLELV
ncbi:BZ3500_MvSof-1268-A1-R1_Chr3-3g06503 [Microbotryum saponariae]|uniref:BZ3500_MvSof-1268-A1-R1_Chr3-3g06503 protein n=1 Tax=Microbotryum saponariae TaxID=289078 RepID=A0A2X0KZP5_9BASI|nr:BZ3500_MvSof-1268-A1-R1_Chr3-3g06503 [Microbotryum saponariae]SDA04470.1 BZ3501_MvSof-1269-A2-R1_Chr3-2g06190 [Microbotryum saponariae]